MKDYSQSIDNRSWYFFGVNAIKKLWKLLRVY